MNIEDTALTPRATMVELFGISDRHFQKLRKAGVFPAVAVNAYDLKTCIANWAAYHADGKTDSTTAEERRLLTIAQRKRIEQEIAARDKELVELADVQRFYLANVQALAAHLDGLAGRLAHELASCTDPAVVRSILLKEHRRVRENYANELQAVSTGVAGRQPTPAATEPDGEPVG
jgi:hypothetical protein